MCIFERSNKRTKAFPKNKKVQRPCKECLWFSWLDAGKRFGVCDKHEKPSDPRDCVVFKRKSL